MFTDMRSDVFPKPYEDTKVKVRWDDSRLYIGAYMQEEHLWGQLTDRDSRVFQENGFQACICMCSFNTWQFDKVCFILFFSGH